MDAPYVGHSQTSGLWDPSFSSESPTLLRKIRPEPHRAGGQTGWLLWRQFHFVADWLLMGFVLAHFPRSFRQATWAQVSEATGVSSRLQAVHAGSHQGTYFTSLWTFLRPLPISQQPCSWHQAGGLDVHVWAPHTYSRRLLAKANRQAWPPLTTVP